MSLEKYSKCEVILEGFAASPHCQHGPTVLFSRGDKKFYACSAYRSRHLCPFYADFESVHGGQNPTSKKKRSSDTYPERETGSTIVNKRLLNPGNNQGQAQYFFSEDTLAFLLQTLEGIQVTHLLCIGTPSLHEKFTGCSYLLDIDQKFSTSVKSFTPYNMCNHHFFADNSGYTTHLKESPLMVVVCDPPFGARQELLFNTFELIQQDWNSCLHKDGKIDFIFINPYFVEGKILKLNSNFRMSDYRIEYAGHKKFKKGDKSPVRFFTTLDLSRIVLPSPDYKFCSKCAKYVSAISKHCKICKSCDSRDGKVYFHCKPCGKCFKETWSHCDSCHACHLTSEDCKVTIPNSKKRKRSGK